MATCAETYNSRNITTGPNRQASIRYLIQGTDSDATAKTTLYATAPTTWTVEDIALPRRNAEIDQIHNDMWIGTVYYGVNSSQPAGTSFYQFDTGGGSQHITQSISTIQRYAPAGGTAPNHAGAIGVTDKSIEGVDIVIPVFNFSEVHYLSDATVSSKQATYFSLTGKVNSATYKGYAAGELLFLGASGSKRDRDDWEMTFRFSASPNKTNLTVGTITGIAKKGWEYLWVQYEEDSDNDAKSLVKKPLAVHIEQVYDYADLNGLGV
jgi:hypothetical protein